MGRLTLRDFQSLRSKVIEIGFNGDQASAHYGGALSCIDFLAICCVEECEWGRDAEDHVFDQVILSKGHACLALYSVLAHVGKCSNEELHKYGKPGSRLLGHPVRAVDLGISVSSGSLGMGLGIGIGFALINKLEQRHVKTFVVVGDGELSEGSCYESIALGAKLQLSSLVCLVDLNGLQQTGSTESISGGLSCRSKFEALGWNVLEVQDGHSIGEIRQGFASIPENDKPSCVIFHTKKGNNLVGFEGLLDSHHTAITHATFTDSLKKIAEEVDGFDA